MGRLRAVWLWVTTMLFWVVQTVSSAVFRSTVSVVTNSDAKPEWWAWVKNGSRFTIQNQDGQAAARSALRAHGLIVSGFDSRIEVF
jgi:hypothetical protein